MEERNTTPAPSTPKPETARQEEKNPAPLPVADQQEGRMDNGELGGNFAPQRPALDKPEETVPY